ncbi:hypothetical protein F5148DRAFT_1189179 [Russula earlei]|uniref:Uncharacterized protein n=1 Tax=Russula earlei TaxID=71964 RepID=A0ACC0UCG0_9AGAM|nr:hypothetical protein F5148DRAFT_1189179 [Russula earlei]
MSPDQPHLCLSKPRLFSASASSDVTKPVAALCNPVPSTATPCSPPHTASTGARQNDSKCHVCFSPTPDRSPSAPSKALPSRPCRAFLRNFHSEREMRPSVAGFATCSHCHADSMQGVMARMSIKDLPTITAGDRNALSIARYPPTSLNPYGSATSTEVQPLSSGPSTAHEDSVNDMLPESVQEAKEQIKQMIDGWKEDAKGVLMFSGLFSAIVAAFLMESYKLLCRDPKGPGETSYSPPPATSVVFINILWLISLVLNIVSALFATLTLQWARRYAQLLQTSSTLRDLAHIRSMRHGIAMIITLLHTAVFFFLAGLVTFFFTINRTVAVVVSVTVGIFGAFYLALTILACLDHHCPYRVLFLRDEGNLSLHPRGPFERS